MPIRISQLPTATSIGGEEFIVIVQNGITKKISIGETLLEGAQGPAGTGYVFKGNWSSVTGYVVNDVVVYNGSSYVSKTNANVNHTPGDNTYWGVVALKGDTGAAGATGATGAQGAQGAQGPQGPAGSIDLGSEVANNYPDVKPTIDLNFEHQQVLDPRVTLTRNCEATYFDEFGVLKIAGTNEPVFDKNPETGESKGLYIAGPSTDLTHSALKSSFAGGTLNDVTVATSGAIAPDGTLTADQLIEGTGAAGKSVSYGAQVYATTRRSFTYSVFVKKGIRANAPNHIQIAMGTTTIFGSNAFANFDIVNGKITRQGYAAYDAKIIKLPNGWFRLAITADVNNPGSAAATAGNVIFINNDPLAGIGPSYTGSTLSDVLIWGPQLEESANLTPYKYNTYATTHSQHMTAITLTNVATTINFALAPDDTYSADRVAETITNATHSFSRLVVATVTGRTYTASVFLKKGIGATAPDNIIVRVGGSAAFTALGANFNIATGGINAVNPGASASIVAAGNGWFKCTVSSVATSTQASSAGCGPVVGFALNNNPLELVVQTYAGQTTTDVFAWGLQAVEGTTLPEYVRSAEIATINTTNKLPLLEGTVISKAEVTQEQSIGRTLFNGIKKDHYLFDAKSGNNQVSLYARKPNNLFFDSSAFIDKNLFRGSEGDSALFNSITSGIILVKDGIANFDNAYYFPAPGGISRNLYKTSVTQVSGDILTISAFVVMQDGSAPVVGAASNLGDFSLVISNALATDNITVTLVSGSLYRVSATRTISTVNSSNNGVVKYSGQSSKPFYVTGYQLEYGSSVTSYQKTEYLTATSTNGWASFNTKILPDQIAAPTGGVFADSITETSASGVHSVYNITFQPKEQHTYLYSMYLKKGVGISAPDIMRLTTSRSSVYSNTWADFNIASGTVAFSTGCVASIENAGNNWYRCSILFDTPEGKILNGGELLNYLYLSFTNNTAGTGYISSTPYTGSVDADVFAWGAQLQENPFGDPASGTLLPYEDGGAPIYTAEVVNASGVMTRAEYQTILSDGIHKFGMAWSSSGVVLFIDGVKVAEKAAPITLTTMPSVSSLGSKNNNTSQWGGTIQRLSIYPRKLSDIVIQSLTE